ncbi:MAG: lactate racemase domain-containing protein, partial [Planctomycetota bacterium]
MSAIGTGYTDRELTEQQMRQIIVSGSEPLAGNSKKVLAIIPDHTRSCPLPAVARELHAALSPRVDRLDFLIALGTHPPMSEEMIDRLLGVPQGGRAEVFGDSEVFNHRWNDFDALTKIGTLPAEQIKSITDGRFAMDIDVTINKRIFDYDIVLIVGPVFPHEVVGFSGGSKYFFPGICGEELLNFFHWLGAMITNPKIIGTKQTPVRALLETSAGMLDVDAYALCMVVRGEGLCGLYFGGVREAWGAAAELSGKVHVVYMDRSF